MPTVTQSINKVLNKLRSELGLGEKPAGSNNNKIVAWYNANVAKIGLGPWCEMTQTWAMWTSGAKELKAGTAWTVLAAEYAQDKINGSSWHWGTKGMRAGDAVYYDWRGSKGKISAIDHVGTVEKVMSDGTFYVLEGNAHDKLIRIRRDSTYVVGYVRFAWDRISDAKVEAPAKPKPRVPTNPNKNRVLKMQTLLGTSANGIWDDNTDAKAKMMRNAARAKAGHPKNGDFEFDVEAVQRIIGTKVDDDWGLRSQAKMVSWIRNFRMAMGIEGGRRWGPVTDDTFLKLRRENLV